MPYIVKGKCVYKKDTGKKVGCTKGDINKYLAALHIHANECTFVDEKPIVERLCVTEFIWDNSSIQTRLLMLSDHDIYGVKATSMANKLWSELSEADQKMLYNVVTERKEAPLTKEWKESADKKSWSFGDDKNGGIVYPIISSDYKFGGEIIFDGQTRTYVYAPSREDAMRQVESGFDNRNESVCKIVDSLLEDTLSKGDRIEFIADRIGLSELGLEASVHGERATVGDLVSNEVEDDELELIFDDGEIVQIPVGGNWAKYIKKIDKIKESVPTAKEARYGKASERPSGWGEFTAYVNYPDGTVEELDIWAYSQSAADRFANEYAERNYKKGWSSLSVKKHGVTIGFSKKNEDMSEASDLDTQQKNVTVATWDAMSREDRADLLLKIGRISDLMAPWDTVDKKFAALDLKIQNLILEYFFDFVRGTFKDFKTNEEKNVTVAKDETDESYWNKLSISERFEMLEPLFAGKSVGSKTIKEMAERKWKELPKEVQDKLSKEMVKER